MDAEGDLQFRTLCARLAEEHGLEVNAGLEPQRANPAIYQPPPAFEGRGDSSAVPRDIRGYEAKVDGERVLYHRHGAPPGTPAAFRDVGRRIDVLDWRSDESTLAALELSAAKWGEFVVTGNEEFKARCARLAAEHGFAITNPELQESIARERARLRVAVEPPPAPEVEPEALPSQAPAPQEPPRERDIELQTPSRPLPSTPGISDDLRNDSAAREAADEPWVFKTEDGPWAIENYGADAVRLMKEFRRLSEQYGPMQAQYDVSDMTSNQSPLLVHFIDQDRTVVRHTARATPETIARMETLIAQRPPEDIPELERDITTAVAQERARVAELGR